MKNRNLYMCSVFTRRLMQAKTKQEVEHIKCLMSRSNDITREQALQIVKGISYENR